MSVKMVRVCHQRRVRVQGIVVLYCGHVETKGLDIVRWHLLRFSKAFVVSRVDEDIERSFFDDARLPKSGVD